MSVTGKLVAGKFTPDSDDRMALKKRAWKALDEINAWHGDNASQHEALVEFVETELTRSRANTPTPGGGAK